MAVGRGEKTREQIWVNSSVSMDDISQLCYSLSVVLSGGEWERRLKEAHQEILEQGCFVI